MKFQEWYTKFWYCKTANGRGGVIQKQTASDRANITESEFYELINYLARGNAFFVPMLTTYLWRECLRRQ